MADGEEQVRGRSSMQAVFDRVSLVERGMSDVREQIAGLTTNVTHLSTQLTRVAANLEQRSSTDWKALAAWASVILAIVGIFFSQIVAPLKQQMETLAVSVTRLNDARLDDAHQAATEVQGRLSRAEQLGRDRERIEQQAREIDKLQRDVEQLLRKGG